MIRLTGSVISVTKTVTSVSKIVTSVAGSLTGSAEFCCIIYYFMRFNRTILYSDYVLLVPARYCLCSVQTLKLIKST